MWVKSGQEELFLATRCLCPLSVSAPRRLPTRLGVLRPRFCAMSMREKLELLQKRRAEAELGGGAERIKAPHDKGKMTARARLHRLLRPGSFRGPHPLATHPAAG